MKNPKEEYIGCLNLILILWLVGGIITIVLNMVFVLTSPMPGLAIGVLVCEIVSLVGLALLLQFKKSGFYLFVGSYIVLLIVVLLVPELFELKWLFRILLGLLLFLILMAIKNKNSGMNGYQVLGITESDEDFEDGETINDDVQIETSETDASISKETITEESTASSSDTISQNNDPELISNEGEIKNDNEEVKDGLASLVKEDETKKGIIANTTKNESS